MEQSRHEVKRRNSCGTLSALLGRSRSVEPLRRTSVSRLRALAGMAGALASALALSGCERRDESSLVDWVDTRGWPEHAKWLAQEIDKYPHKELQAGYYYLQSDLYWARPVWDDIISKQERRIFQERARFKRPIISGEYGMAIGYYRVDDEIFPEIAKYNGMLYDEGLRLFKTYGARFSHGKKYSRIDFEFPTTWSDLEVEKRFMDYFQYTVQNKGGNVDGGDSAFSQFRHTFYKLSSGESFKIRGGAGITIYFEPDAPFVNILNVSALDPEDRPGRRPGGAEPATVVFQNNVALSERDGETCVYFQRLTAGLSIENNEQVLRYYEECRK